MRTGARRWQLTAEERAALAKIHTRPLGIRTIVAVARRSPRAAPEIVGAMKEGAMQGIAANSRLVWLLSALRIREVVPDAGAGATWGDENLFLDALRPYLTPEKRILDLGCGAGRIARHVAPAVDELLCVDPSRLFLSEAAAELAPFSNVRLIQNHGYQLSGVADASVDVVYAQGVFSYLDPLQALALLADVKRVLTRGGHCVINFITIDRAPGARRAVENALACARRGRFGASCFRPYAGEQVRAMYRIAGLTVEHGAEVDRDDGFYPTTFVGRSD